MKGVKKVMMESLSEDLNECLSFSRNTSETSRGQAFSFSTREVTSKNLIKRAK